MTEAKTLLVLMCIQPGEPIRAETVMARTGLSRSDAGPRLWRLCRDGKLMQLDRGIYALVGNRPPSEAFAQEVRDAEKAKRLARVKASKARYAAKRSAARKVEEQRKDVYARKPGYYDAIVAQGKDAASRHPLAGVWA